ncbi:MAG: malto-oligosyltrehalose trehalohydrolase [Planctomycetaceae bacterium]|nr:malto-oligosyltrehalose trehalohydrolase [Planctomycetaceae bacterium]
MPWTNPPTAPRIGAWLANDGWCEWCVWAPRASRVELVLDPSGANRELTMQPLGRGYWSVRADGITEGMRYWYRLDGGEPRPDPASKWQPGDVHEPSAVVDLNQFAWTDHNWQGLRRDQLVIYEFHVGAFTPEGTFAAAIDRLDDLVELGVTAVEPLPICQFPGRHNWGYDGTYWFAPQASYGGPHRFQQFVDACHARGLAVIVDVVYNHLGPEGNYLGTFGPYFSGKYHTPWGSAVNFDDPHCDGVRELVLENVRYWIREFHVDGLRLDAIHAIYDTGVRHILADIGDMALEESEHVGRPVHVIAESAMNDPRVLEPIAINGYSHAGQWNDDFHHCVHRHLTGETTGYYMDYANPARDLAKVFTENYFFDGQFSPFRQRHHGRSAASFPGDQFVISTQTHDQVGNRARGERLIELSGWPQARLAASLMLLAPAVPMLFMGEEYGETNRFPFFCDFLDEGLRQAVRDGRRREFAEFGWKPSDIPDPCATETFESARLSWSWPTGSPQEGMRRLYQDLLQARKIVPALQDFVNREAEVCQPESDGGILRLSRGGGEQSGNGIVVFFNLSPRPLSFTLPKKLEVLFCSESPRYQGTGFDPLAKELPAFSAVVCGGASFRDAFVAT